MNTLKFLNGCPIKEDTYQHDICAIRTMLFNKGVCWTDEVQGNFVPGHPFRVVLYTRQANVDYSNPLAKECNGLVLLYDKVWRLLAMPQYGFCNGKISMKHLSSLYSSGVYDVFAVLDATILTLYYYAGSWRLSSTKSYDVSDVPMVTGMTFTQAIEDLIATKYNAFNMDDLSPTRSYTVALRHSQYHIFDETRHLVNRPRYFHRIGGDMNSYFMLMCVADLATASYAQNPHVQGLPHQMPIETIRGGDIQTLKKYAEVAYSKFAKAHNNKNFKYKPLYGCILRAKYHSVPDEYSTIYFESELLRAIKFGLYKNNQPLRDMNYDKLVVQMALNHNRYQQFRILFPQFETKFWQLEEGITRIAAKTTMRIVSADNPEMSDEDEKDLKSCDIKLIGELADRFSAYSDVTADVIRDALYSYRYKDVLYELTV